MKIAFVVSEVAPYSSASELGELTAGLTSALAQLGHSVTVISPRYSSIDSAAFRLGQTRHKVWVMTSDREELAGYETHQRQAIPHVFVRHDSYFDRPGIYGEGRVSYVDNAERFAFLCKAALGYLSEAAIKPDVIHVHDWPSALVPVYLKALGSKVPGLGRARTVLTVHDFDHQGVFETSEFHHVNLPREYNSPQMLRHHGKLNFLKGGILAADRVTAPSRRHVEEMRSGDSGLEEILAARGDAVVGVLDGIDYTAWNPDADRYLKANYTPDDLIGKRSCKADLQTELGLEREVETPIVAMISRLTDGRGLDLVTQCLEGIVQLGVQFALLGSGERRYEEFFKQAAQRQPGRVGVYLGASDLMARKILGGSDMMLFPSRREPGGSQQLMALRYGSIPVARATGGLDDAVRAVNRDASDGTGFKFQEASARALMATIEIALDIHRHHREMWRGIVERAMSEDHSWARAAQDYLQVYRQAAAVPA